MIKESNQNEKSEKEMATRKSNLNQCIREED